jgi:hypothetical protein
MTDQERLYEAVLQDLKIRVQETISASEDEYRLGNLHGRLIAFALAEVINKDEFNRFHDQLEAAGFESIRYNI